MIDNISLPDVYRRARLGKAFSLEELELVKSMILKNPGDVVTISADLLGSRTPCDFGIISTTTFARNGSYTLILNNPEQAIPGTTYSSPRVSIVRSLKNKATTHIGYFLSNSVSASDVEKVIYEYVGGSVSNPSGNFIFSNGSSHNLQFECQSFADFSQRKRLHHVLFSHLGIRSQEIRQYGN